MLPQCSHITRKRGVYFYRRRLPFGLTGEVTLSLRTRTYREAEWLAQQLDEEFKRTIERVNDTNKNTDIPRILRQYLKQRLDFDMARRADSPHRSAFPSDGGAGVAARFVQDCRTEGAFFIKENFTASAWSKS